MDQAFPSYASVTAAVTRPTPSPSIHMPTSQDRDTDVQGSVVQSTVSSPCTTLHQTCDVRVRSTSQPTAPQPQPKESGISQGAQASLRDTPSADADDAQFTYTDIRYRQSRGTAHKEQSLPPRPQGQWDRRRYHSQGHQTIHLSSLKGGWSPTFRSTTGATTTTTVPRATSADSADARTAPPNSTGSYCAATERL